MDLLKKEKHARYAAGCPVSVDSGRRRNPSSTDEIWLHEGGTRGGRSSSRRSRTTPGEPRITVCFGYSTKFRIPDPNKPRPPKSPPKPKAPAQGTGFPVNRGRDGKAPSEGRHRDPWQSPPPMARKKAPQPSISVCKPLGRRAAQPWNVTKFFYARKVSRADMLGAGAAIPGLSAKGRVAKLITRKKQSASAWHPLHREWATISPTSTVCVQARAGRS